MEKYTGFIYRAYCLITKKSYIGQTSISVDHRKNQHLWSSFNENDSSWHLYFHKAIRKYGIDNFEWSTLETITSDSKENLYECLDNLEIKYIQQYDSYYNGYNLTLGGNAARYSAKKITIYNSNGQVLSYFNSAKEVAQHFNISEDIVRVICRKEQQFLYKNKVRYIIRYSDYNLTRQEVEYIKSLNYSNVVKMYDLSGTLLNIYESCKEISEIYNVGDYNIQSCCTRVSKYTNIGNSKFIFRYGDDPVTEEDLEKIKKEVYKIRAINSKTKEIIGVYNSYTEASKALNVAIGSISKCCKGLAKSAGKVNGIKIYWEYES